MARTGLAACMAASIAQLGSLSEWVAGKGEEEEQELEKEVGQEVMVVVVVVVVGVVVVVVVGTPDEAISKKQVHHQGIGPRMGGESLIIFIWMQRTTDGCSVGGVGEEPGCQLQLLHA
jgi:cytochrome bd-type quinol oxidase subunit 2